MALTPVQQVRIFIGDVPSSPFYQLFTDEEIQSFIDMSNGNIMEAIRFAAIAASMQLSGTNTRERTGDIEVWNSLSTQYLKALDNIIKDPSFKTIPSGLMPYAAGISWEDVIKNDSNPDNVRSPLVQIKLCDNDSLIFNESLNCGCLND
jgi:hypothetical protein